MMENRNFMKCAEFEEILHELDRPGTKGNELREEALIHAESCGNCGVLLTETESLDFALKRVANGADAEMHRRAWKLPCSRSSGALKENQRRSECNGG